MGEPVPVAAAGRRSRGRRAGVVLLSWLSMLGFDFFLHGGLLAAHYVKPALFLLPLEVAFQRIPLGYLSFLLNAVLLVWLMARLEIASWRGGCVFGLRLGAFIQGAGALGLLSISTAEPALMCGWFIGQTVEMGIAGGVAGSGLAGAKLPALFGKVLAFVLVMFILAIVMQNVGLAPARRF